MIQKNVTSVSAAFDIVLEEIETEIDFVNQVGSRAFEERDYEKAKEALEQVGLVTAFRSKVVGLKKEWDELTAAEPEGIDEAPEATSRRDLGRLQRGLRTPEPEFRLPILKVLAEMGDSGKTAEVLDRVGEFMANELQDVDHQPLASNANLPRWRNTAMWARQALVADGLMKQDSPRGVWEISDKGRQELEQ